MNLIAPIVCCMLAAVVCQAGTADLNYPRPDFKRDAWVDLNGKWAFAFDDKDAGLSEKWFTGHKFDRKINVPYPYQAKLSGIGETERHKVVWYSRKFEVPGSFSGKEVHLNIGAADYAVTVWVNGHEVGKDEGGYVPFSFDITPYIQNSENDLVIRVFDDPADGEQPRGKQRPGGENRWHYTHITGIWQPVWLEAVPEKAIKDFKINTRLEPRGADITVTASGGDQIRAIVSQNGKEIAAVSSPVNDYKAEISLSMPNARLWSPENPALYDLTLEVVSRGQVVDKVSSYLGIRSIALKDKKILLNDKPIWLNMTLVQGYWPDGLYVPSSPEEYVKDIQRCKDLGLNAIRMHQKVEDPRFLCLCDKMGLLVWGEMANAAEGTFSKRAGEITDAVWTRAIQRDYNHPSIITWAYCNEWWMHNGKDASQIMQYAKGYQLLKSLDSTRPVIDNSGYLHVKTDIYDLHGPGSNKEVVSWVNGKLAEPSWPTMPIADNSYQGQPIIRSEWAMSDFDKADESWYQAYERSVINAAKTGLFCGQCYVQLNDIENELNGYMTYDRKWKVDVKRVADMHARATQVYNEEVKP